jgi:hypothetical protein
MRIQEAKKAKEEDKGHNHPWKEEILLKDFDFPHFLPSLFLHQSRRPPAVELVSLKLGKTRIWQKYAKIDGFLIHYLPSNF